MLEAIRASGVDAVKLEGTANKRSDVIAAFQGAEGEEGGKKAAARVLTRDYARSCEITRDHTRTHGKKAAARVLVLNLRDESASGANLTAANHAIFVHPLLVGTQQEFNSCDTQAVGRVRRYGQHRTVQVRADAPNLPRTLHEPSTNPPPTFHQPSTSLPPTFHQPSPPTFHHPSTHLPRTAPWQIYRFIVDATIDTEICGARRADSEQLLRAATAADAIAPAE